MFSQTKSFTIRLISDLLETGNAIDNSVHTTKTSKAIERYKNDIEQHTVYAIEHETGLIEILQNSTIRPLIEYLRNIQNEDISPLQKRRLANTSINICMLSPKSSIEDIALFKSLID